MSDDDSYVEVPAAAQELLAEEDHDHPTESFKTDTLGRQKAPAAPNMSASTLEWKSLIVPIGTLVLAAILASVHHGFNHLQNGKLVPVAMGVIHQHLVTLIGVGFSFGFTSAVGITMGFVRLQCLWLSVVRQPLTIQQIDTIYRIERQDQLYQTLPRALCFSPTIVIFSALTLLLPLSGVFAPGSLTVTTKDSTHVDLCVIPTGNLSTPNYPDSQSFFMQGGTLPSGYLNASWAGITPRVRGLTMQWFSGQRIPDLPRVCGPNCRYKVHIPSFVFKCIPNPSSLPYGQAGNPMLDFNTFGNGTTEPIRLNPSHSLWNGTTDPNSKWGFYISWSSEARYGVGTSGNASCSPFQAKYDVEVQTKGGVQSVLMNITEITDPMPDVTNAMLLGGLSDDMYLLWMQLASLSYATRALFLGSAFYEIYGGDIIVTDTRPVPTTGAQGDGLSFIWGDVVQEIEEMSHNVTAALLTLQLGNMNAECFIDEQAVVYQYTSFALWASYGTALGIALLSLIIAVMIMARNNTGDITTSFSDTAILMRNVDEGFSAGAKLRLRAAEDGKLGYTLE